jgi:hypothetical protein
MNRSASWLCHGLIAGMPCEVVSCNKSESAVDADALPAQSKGLSAIVCPGTMECGGRDAALASVRASTEGTRSEPAMESPATDAASRQGACAGWLLRGLAGTC